MLALALPLREQVGPGESLSLGVALPETIGISATGQASQVRPWMKEYTSGDLPSEFRLVAFLQKSRKVDARLTLTYADHKMTSYDGSVKFKADDVGTR